ncbi:MAG: aspartate aminotransferase family protein [Gemmatimonadetes bacterium]|nr:aspartate aminotransferase family protein [Gemmatimonadota bacterium]
MTATATMPVLPACSHTPQPYTGPSKAELIAMRKQHLHPAIFHFYKDPLLIVEGYMQYLYDETGRRYLDCLAGIVTVSVGHSHPKFVARVQEQVGTLQHATTIYLHPNIALLAKKLASKMPKGLEVTYFTNSGTEANELAIMMARLHTGASDVITLRHAYHGGSPVGMGLTGMGTWKHPVEGMGRVHHALNPDPATSPFSGSVEELSALAANDVKDIIRTATPGKVAAFLCEPIQGAGGVMHGAPNYLKDVYGHVRAAGGLCIADEVQTAFGRTGDHYWGFENFGVVPDMVTMAKGLGNGAPIGAVTTRMDIAKSLSTRLHFNTFGGNPVSMAAGLAVLDIIDEEGLQANAKARGAEFRAGLEKIQRSHRLVGDVRGMGLMLGVELVQDRATRAPAKQAAMDVLEAAREMGLLLGKGGIDGNVLRIKPPMCITAADVEFAVDVLERAVGAAG